MTIRIRESWEPILQMGTRAERSLMGPYPTAYCTAWPASWAATPTDAMLLEPYTASDRRITLLRGS